MRNRLLKRCGALLVMWCMVVSGHEIAQAQKSGKYGCDQKQFGSMCTAANTCGSPSAPCVVDVRRSGNSANVRPGIPDGKSNQLFCVKAGTSIVWMSSSKNTGFMVSFGSDSPFEPAGPITGGGKKQATVKAAHPGCYKYDVGAFYSGSKYGMGGGNTRELIILP